MDDSTKDQRWIQTGALIRKYRKAHELTQKQLADKIAKFAEVNSPVAKTDVQISRIETGESGTSPETLDAIISVLPRLTAEEKDALYKASRYHEPSDFEERCKEAVEKHPDNLPPGTVLHILPDGVRDPNAVPASETLNRLVEQIELLRQEVRELRQKQ